MSPLPFKDGLIELLSSTIAVGPNMSQAEVLQQKLEHWCAASIRALCGEASISYKGHHLYYKGRPFPVGVPYLHLDLETHNYRDLRGVADGIALRFLYSDHELHRQLMPEGHLQRWIFEFFEQLRVESLVPQTLQGIKVNIKRRFLYWLEHVSASSLTEGHAGILIFSLVAMCWSRLSGNPLPEPIENLIEPTRASIGELTGEHLIGLKQYREDQQAYSYHALAIAKIISGMMADALSEQEDAQDNERIEDLVNKKINGLNLLYADDASLEHSSENTLVNNNKVIAESETPYKIFTTAYDREIDIVHLVRAELLHKMRIGLDKRLQQQNVNIPRLARYFHQLFSQPKLSGWSFRREEGHLDSSRLTRLLTSPNDRKLFRLETDGPKVDSALTILIDNSGSMKQHCEDIAVIVDILIRALEMAGVKTEVLGFTTGNWNGGRPYKKWLASGRSKNPGRMNELCHIIYKTADTPWRRSRQAIAGLLKQDLFRESIDGEALKWAYSRIVQRSENRRMIMVISDGSPMDTATQLTNTENYLDKHLQQVAADIESRQLVSLCALGLGLDLSAYYSRSQIILNRELDTKAFFEIADLLHRY